MTTSSGSPFDLTKIWPHADYPLIEVGVHTLNRNPDNHFAEIEQAAFAPSNLVPGIGLSPDKMLLARSFSYADAHRARLGANFHHLPINRPDTKTFDYMIDGAGTVLNRGNAPVYAPNSFGAPWSDEEGVVAEGWESDGEMVRQAYTLHAEDDDFGQAGTLVRDVVTDEQRDRFVDTLATQFAEVKGDVQQRCLWYATQIDAEIGACVAAKLAEKPSEKPKPTGFKEPSKSAADPGAVGKPSDMPKKKQ